MRTACLPPLHERGSWPPWHFPEAAFSGHGRTQHGRQRTLRSPPPPSPSLAPAGQILAESVTAPIHRMRPKTRSAARPAAARPWPSGGVRERDPSAADPRPRPHLGAGRAFLSEAPLSAPRSTPSPRAPAPGRHPAAAATPSMVSTALSVLSRHRRNSRLRYP